MLETVITMLMSLGMLVMILMIYYIFKESGARILDLAASEYP